MHTGFVPQSQFNPVANANLVVNHAEVIPDDMGIDSQLLSHIAVCEPFCYQLYDTLLLGARRAVLVSKGHGCSGPSIRAC